MSIEQDGAADEVPRPMFSSAPATGRGFELKPETIENETQGSEGEGKSGYWLSFRISRLIDTYRRTQRADGQADRATGFWGFWSFGVLSFKLIDALLPGRLKFFLRICLD